jgi:hypothetical protein
VVEGLECGAECKEVCAVAGEVSITDSNNRAKKSFLPEENHDWEGVSQKEL